MAGIGTIVAMIKALGNKTDQEIAQIEGDVSEVKTAIQGKPDIDNSSKTGVDLDVSDENGTGMLEDDSQEVTDDDETTD